MTANDLDDLDVLITRALLNERINVFGEDAGGRNYYQPFFSTVALVDTIFGAKRFERSFQVSTIVTYAIEFLLVTSTIGELYDSLGMRREEQGMDEPVVDTVNKLNNAKLIGDRNLELGLRAAFQGVGIPDVAWTLPNKTIKGADGNERTQIIFFLDKIPM
jgi:hypothetical protein